MSTWPRAEIDKIAKAEELDISSLRNDGSLRKPVTIWVVQVGDDLYVRSVNGRGSGWFRGVQTRYNGHIRAGGVDKDVTFVEVSNVEVSESNLHEQIDAAYRTKYRRYAANIINSTTTPDARSATLKLVPRSTNS